jgi:hypothetical protein
MFDLEPTDDLAKPAFRDAVSCTKWLSQLQLTNLNLAQSTLRAQLDELNRLPMRGKDRLQTLEAMREPINGVQADFAKKLFGKKLPLATEELASLAALCSLWQSMLNGYLRCLQSLNNGDYSLTADAALLAHRCLIYSGLHIDCFLRTGYEPDAKSWQRLHTIYAHAEEQRLQLESVADKLNCAHHAATCRMVYVKTLLLHRARLLGLRRNQWQILDNWLDNWGDILTIEPSCSMSRDDAPPLAVDFAGTRGLISIYRATSAASMRFLAMVPLSKLIRVKTILLQQGQSPQQNALGNELNSKDCIDLLNKLHSIWCEPSVESLVDEPRAGPSVKLCNGLESIYAHIAGKPFTMSSVTGIAEKEVLKQIETFGRVLDVNDTNKLQQLGFLEEEWQVETDGLLHGRMLRKSNGGTRLGLNQIISVQNPGSSSYKVGVVTLVHVTHSGQLYIGVRYLPGMPQAAISQCSAKSKLHSGATAALLLPEMANLRIPASIIIPRDWFQSGRAMDITVQGEPKLSVKLGISVEIGNDFERVSYLPVN